MGLLRGQWTFEGTTEHGGLSALPFLPTADESSTTANLCDGALRLELRGFPSVNLEGSYGGLSESPTEPLVVWDGRLDNAPDLIRELGVPQGVASSDAEIAANAYGRWGIDAFRRIKGDWALTVWNPKTRSLLLAKDPIGTRPLFYSLTPRTLKWSSSLDWLVQNSDASLALNYEYLAGWLTFFPAADLTPYCGILAVPPACFVEVQSGRAVIRKYWEFLPQTLLRYRTDFEYEEHFRSVFTSSIRRRLRSSQPILAELSGGVDSSSIVCVADALLTHERGLSPRLDTLSYYDDSEPNWNERPYFSLVEAKRGRKGLHVQIDHSQDLAPLFEDHSFAAVPADLGRTSGIQVHLAAVFQSQNYDCILSGVGGDEFTGGVPTPIPELADILVRAQIPLLVHQLKSWSLSQRRPWIHVLWDTVRCFVPFLASSVSTRRPPSWVKPHFQRRFRRVLAGYEERLRPWGCRPSFQENLSAVEALRRQLAASNVNSEGNIEKRYPYLDSDFLEFLFAVPREQLVQPGRRRSLMRRALAGIVPHDILNRKRKAYVTRGPLTAIAARWADLQSLTRSMVTDSFGIVSSELFRQALENAHDGKEIGMLPIQRALLLECWLRNLMKRGLLPRSQSREEIGSLSSTMSPPVRRHREKSFG